MRIALHAEVHEREDSLQVPIDRARFYRELGQRMKAARVASWGPVQQACASALNVGQSQISRWESGQAPGIFDLIRFARACNKTVEELVGVEAATIGEQLLLGLDAEAANVVVDLVALLKARTERPTGRRRARRTG